MIFKLPSIKILSGIPYTPNFIEALPSLSWAIYWYGSPNFVRYIMAFFWLSLKFIPNIHQNKRSDRHISKSKKFDTEIHKKYLRHIDINNLEGIEIDTIYNWKIGETLIFDRTLLHSASSNIDNKKLGLSTFTKK